MKSSFITRAIAALIAGGALTMATAGIANAAPSVPAGNQPTM